MYTQGWQGFPETVMDSDGDFVVVWDAYNGQDGSGTGIYARRYSSLGVPLGSEFRVNTATGGTQELSNVAMDDAGNFVVVWQSSDGGAYDVKAQRFSASGLAMGTEFQVNNVTTKGSNPSVAMDSDGDFVVAWNNATAGGRAMAKLFSSSGVPTSDQFFLNPVTAVGQSNPSVAMDAAGNFSVALRGFSQALQMGSITARQFTAGGLPIADEFPVNNAVPGLWAQDPRIAMTSTGQFVVIWDAATSGSDIFARQYSSQGVPLANEFRVSPVQTNGTFHPAVAIDDSGDFVVAWSHFNFGGTTEVFAQVVRQDGSFQDSAFRANMDWDGDQQRPAVAMGANKDIVVAWANDLYLTNSQRIFARMYQGSPRILSTTIGDGSSQRSMVKNLEISFCEPVTILSNSAFQLVRLGPGGVTGNVAVVASQTGSVISLSFASTGSVGLDAGGSLLDGTYRLTLLSNQILGSSGLPLDGDGNHQPGGNYLLDFHRLFGDGNGDRTVNAADFLAFRLAYLSSSLAFDSNGDGAVDSEDFLQFRLRFLQTV